MKRIATYLSILLSSVYMSFAQVIPFDYESHLYVKAIVAGQDTTKLLFDTGASGAYFDKDYLQSLGIDLMKGEDSPHGQEVQVSGAGQARMTALFAQSLQMQLGDSTYNLSWPVALPLDSLLGPALGRRFDGIVGWNLFKEEALSIDFESSQMAIKPLAEMVEEYGESGWIPYQIFRNKINIPVTLELSDGSMIDTYSLIDLGGAHSIILTNQLCDEHDVFTKVGKTIPWVNPRGGVGGKFSSEYCRLTSVKMGDQRLAMPIAQLSRNTTGELASNAYGANLGNRLLARYTLVFNFVDEKVKLIPNRTIEDPHVFTRTGIFIGYDPAISSLVIMRILEGSSGEAAGLQPGDRLIRLNDTSIKSYGYHSAQKYLKYGEGGIIQLVIGRGDEEITKTIEARDML